MDTIHQPENNPKPTVDTSRRPFTERFSTSIKVVVIGVLVLLLLIPLGMVESLIHERQQSKNGAIADITSKWGDEQTITGPCLVIPYTESYIDGKNVIVKKRNLLVLPETLDVNIETQVEKRKRGIYEASVYGSDIQLQGAFDLAALTKAGIDSSKIVWNEALVILGLSDLKGIKEDVSFHSEEQTLRFEPGLPVESMATGTGSKISSSTGRDYRSYDYYGGSTYEIFSVGLNTKINLWQNEPKEEKIIPFNITLKINGSQGLYIVPTGKRTTVAMRSDWSSPSFDGSFLPEERNVEKDGFTAQWKVLDLNRSFGQVIHAENTNTLNQMAGSRFGTQFIQAVDEYQQNIRSVKYAILIILLTFVAVFFIELLQKKSVNALYYLLIGLALILFYALLLSLSEVIGFHAAYLLAAAMTLILIAIYIGSILKSAKQGTLMGALLAFLYLFIFVLIRMESFSLLVGCLGLFIFLAIIMYYSRKIRL